VGEVPRAEYARLRESVALVEFPERGLVHLSGPEGPEFLQGLVTNDDQKLRDGSGCQAAILTPMGKVFAMLDVFRAAPDALHLLLQDDGGPRVVEFLERYRFSEIVEIADLSGKLAWLSLQGPSALDGAEAVCGAGDLGPHGFRALSFGDRTLRVTRMDEAGVPGVHFLIRSDGAHELRGSLARTAGELGGGVAGLTAWHACRIEAGVPWMGAELDESVLPMDVGLFPILDLEKGCYIGQEVVSRGIVQGRPNWGLWGLRVPPDSGVLPGQELKGLDRNRPLIRVRSVTRLPGSRELLALALVHREAARPGRLRVRGEAGEIELTVEQLPFRRASNGAAASRRLADLPARGEGPVGGASKPRGRAPGRPTVRRRFPRIEG
jgi:folate-binding protein YgfZ